jgi:hypothetical protein
MSTNEPLPRTWREIARDIVAVKDPKKVIELAAELAAALEREQSGLLPNAPYTGQAQTPELCSEPGCARPGGEKINGNVWCDYHAEHKK